ncbi:MAG: helix-turn-helix domain-containing protein [Deinococcales bacterium]
MFRVWYHNAMKAVKAFKYRIYPNKGQEQKLLWTLDQV